LCAVLALLNGCLIGIGDTLEYNGALDQSAAIGETLPGSNIRYVAYSERGAEVLINEQRALKKVGDSLDWRGSPAAGVNVAVTQRVVLFNAQRLQTVGTVKLTVQGTTPAAAAFPGQTRYSYRVAVTYTVKRGAIIPGTAISYAGKSNEGARLGGVEGYPYRKMGDSIAWQGRLRGNVYLDMTLRVLAYTDDLMQVGGLATIGIVE
jgi:hypothetical protein